MSLSAINFAGLGTGIDTNSIIKQLISIDRRPQDLLKTQVTRLQAQQTAFSSVSAQLLGLQSAASNIDGLRSFDLVTTSSSDSTVATATAKTGAQVGTHSIVVNNLATAQRVSSSMQTSQTAPLGFAGQILINGKAINVQSSDSLQTLAQNINAAQPGAGASIISPTSGQYYLTLASNSTGLQGALRVADTGSGNLFGGPLALFTADGAAALGHAVDATMAGSDLFADSATSVGTLLGITAPAAGSVTLTANVGGTPTSISVTIDLNKSLSGIASDINTAFGSTSVATVATVTDPTSGAVRQQLQLSGVSDASGMTDANNVLADLGITKRTLAAGRELIAATDAKFTIDNLSATRSSNTFSDAITGVTISLLKDGGATTNLGVASDTTTIKANISAFVKSFNDTVDMVANYSSFDPSTGTTGVLFGDATTSTIIDSLVSHSTDVVSGLPTNMSLLSQIGITLDQGSHLVIDDTALSSALSNNLKNVARIFRANGEPSNSAIQFVNGTADTRPSGASGYSVQVTAPAIQASVTAPQTMIGNLTQDEAITFGGSAFGTQSTSPLRGYQLTLHAGSSLDDIISQINGDSKLGPILSASKSGNSLTVTSKQYGSASELAIVSALLSGTPGSSGIGSAILNQHGTDVAGTINGEPATGVGQFLTGSMRGATTLGNGRALGLQLRVTATSAGNYGTITYSSGVADLARNFLNTQTDPYTGTLTTTANGIGDMIKDLQSQIAEMDTTLSHEQDRLKAQFAAMEGSVANLKSASAGLASLTALPAATTSGG